MVRSWLCGRRSTPHDGARQGHRSPTPPHETGPALESPAGTWRRAPALVIQRAESAETWVISAQRSSPSRSKNRVTVASSRPTAAHNRRPLSWSTTIVRYLCGHAEISSIPIRRSPASRSTCPSTSTWIRSTIPPTVRHPTGHQLGHRCLRCCCCQPADRVLETAVNLDPCRAHGTSDATTLRVRQRTRDASASMNT